MLAALYLIRDLRPRRQKHPQQWQPRVGHMCSVGVPREFPISELQQQWSLASPWLNFTSLPSLQYHSLLDTQSHHLKPLLVSCSVVLGSLPS